jgi:hypothetical protein
MKYTVLFTLFSTFCFASCSGNTGTASLIHDKENAREQDLPDNCPPEPKGFAYNDHKMCFIFPDGNYAAKTAVPCFWAKVLAIRLPEIINHTPIPPKGLPFSGISADGKSPIENGYAAYYHFEGANHTDSFSLEFMNPDKEGCNGEQFIMTGINENGKPVHAQIHTMKDAELTAATAINFQ